jgi:hypothetical protein
MIYLYAVAEEAPHGFRNLGLESQPVYTMGVAGLHVVHSRHDSEFEPDVTPEALWTHEAIVDELLESGAVLPFRFGTMLPDHAAVAKLMARCAEPFRKRLADLRDRVELAVRVGGTAGDPAPPETAEEVLSPLDSLASASRRRDARSAPIVVASYLVPRADVALFASTVQGLQQEHPELAVSCTGPWAPYSFVVEDLA